MTSKKLTFEDLATLRLASFFITPTVAGEDFRMCISELEDYKAIEQKIQIGFETITQALTNGIYDFPFVIKPPASIPVVLLYHNDEFILAWSGDINNSHFHFKLSDYQKTWFIFTNDTKGEE